MRSVATLFRSKDVWAGLLFAAFGAAFVFFASGMRLGTAHRMGPAYFPTILGALLIALGLAIAVRGARARADRVAIGALRPVAVVLAAVLAFALAVQPLGVLVATVALVIVSRLGAAPGRALEVLALAAALAVLAALLFVRALGLPLKILP